MSDAYRGRISARILSILEGADPRPSFPSLLLELRGTPPALARRILSDLHIELPEHPPEPRDPGAPGHPLDFEWRFTEETVAALHDRLASYPRLLLLGAPSLYAELGQRGYGKEIHLVDWAPWRFPNDPRYLVFDLRHGDLAETDLPLADASFFDAPWYPDDLLLWLYQACRKTRVGGEIFFAIWPELTRPGAALERERIFALADRIGTFEVHEGALTYRVPSFERHALDADRVDLPGPWRRGDLVALSAHHPFPEEHRPEPVALGHSWRRYLFDDTQIAIRTDREADTRQPAIRTVPGLDGWFLNTVSRRSPLREHIDLWDARNFVARLEGHTVFLEVLDNLCAGRSPASDDIERTAHALLLEHALIPESPRRTWSWTIQS